MATGTNSPAVTLPFNDNAPKAFSFADAMQRKFGDKDTVRQIMETLDKLLIPVPQSEDEYVSAQAGALLFSNKHGVMIRIESPTAYVPDDEGFAVGMAVRANDSAWMLQPIGTVKAGKAVIEIIPGVHYETRDAESRKLYWKMWADGYDYWDDRVDNIGRLPDLPGLPGSGVPVIIDRLAVQKMGGSPYQRVLQLLKGEKNLYKYRSPVRVPPSPNAELRQEWDEMVKELLAHKVDPARIENQYDREGYEEFLKNYRNYWPKEDKSPHEPVQDDYIAIVKTLSILTQERMKDETRSREILGKKDPQEILYGALRRAFDAAWNGGDADAKKVAGFWQKILAAKSEGRLVDGWNEVKIDDEYVKTTKAQKTAVAYGAQAAKIGLGG